MKLTIEALAEMYNYLSATQKAKDRLPSEQDFLNTLYIYGFRKKKLHISLYVEWRDIWVGAYIDKYYEVVYVCLIPCIVIKIWRHD